MSNVSVWTKGTKESKLCAFCLYHSCYMTSKQLKRKNCMDKNGKLNPCKHLIKLHHPLWSQGGNYESN